MMVGQGLKDRVIYPPTTLEFAAQLCQTGEPVYLREYPDAEHMNLPESAMDDTIAWISNLLAGQPPPSNCQ
jgi:hypothetical protein